MKYDFLFRQPIYNYQHLTEFLSKAVEEYNNLPINKLFGLTSTEALAGHIPKQYQYTQNIKTAAKQRILTIMNTDCQKCPKDNPHKINRKPTKIPLLLSRTHNYLIIKIFEFS